MKISEIRIKLMDETSDRLRAFCSVTIDDCFVIRDLKIIDGVSGPFVAMPSRKLTGNCNRCHHKNHLRANYCNNCGTKQTVTVVGNNPQKLYADVAHPINSDCREIIQNAVITEFEAELSRAGEPGYRSRYDDGFDIDAGEAVDVDEVIAAHDDSGESMPTKVSPVGDSNDPDRTAEIDGPTSAVPPPAGNRKRPRRASVNDPSASDRSGPPADRDEDEFGKGIL